MKGKIIDILPENKLIEMRKYNDVAIVYYKKIDYETHIVRYTNFINLEKLYDWGKK